MEHLGKEKWCLSNFLQGPREKVKLGVTLLPQIIESNMLGQERVGLASVLLPIT